MEIERCGAIEGTEKQYSQKEISLPLCSHLPQVIAREEIFSEDTCLLARVMLVQVISPWAVCPHSEANAKQMSVEQSPPLAGQASPPGLAVLHLGTERSSSGRPEETLAEKLGIAVGNGLSA